MVEASHHHRATLKQKNKPFKSKHATKSSLKEQAKGKAPRQSPKSTSSSDAAAAQLRANRKNAAKLAQIKKRQELVSATRLFNGINGTPRVVAVVPLSSDVSARDAVRSLAEALDVDSSDCPEFGQWRLKADRFKTSILFVLLPYRSLFPTLDAIQSADYVLFALSPIIEVDTWGDTLLRSLQAQGMPTVVSCCVGSSAPESEFQRAARENKKGRQATLKSLLSFMQYFAPTQTRVYDLDPAYNTHDASGDRLQALRALCEGRPQEVRWREGRTWMLAENVAWTKGEDDGSAEEELGTLEVTGFVRGAPLNANRLVHLGGFGDFQIAKIVSSPLPQSRARLNGMDVEPTTLAEPDTSDADSLVSTNVPDDLEGEQTWPTEEDIASAPANGVSVDEHIPDAKAGTTPKRVTKVTGKTKKVPKGWSAYQAAWIVDDEDEDEGEGDSAEIDDEGDGEDIDMKMDSGEDGGVREGSGVVDDEEEELEEVEMESRKGVDFEDLDMEEETKQLEDWRTRTREAQAEDDAAFPDEIDTPQDIPARTRFARYRGLKSFRTSPWDPYENLPKDYARLFQFEDFRRTERAVRRRGEEAGGVEPGTRVTVYLKNVPKEAGDVDLRLPFVLHALMQHEHKKTVLNFTVQRNTEFTEPVRSKDPLLLCYGPFRVRVNPIFSQHTRGGGKGANNVHKFERWLRHGVTSVATVYGPVAFGRQPCFLMKETEDTQAPELVAMGSFMNPDTTRIIAKRIILTGHPFKVHKKTATVRYMFFNADDVMYFKPIQLHTKYGRTGHIKESLGTHGYFKAHFDGPINQMDTVCMSLYKRVYPRWSNLAKGLITPIEDTRSSDQDVKMEE